MRVALVHDWLTGMRGGERCLKAFLNIYPDADIFTLLHVPGSTDAIIDAQVKQTSFLQKLPNAKRLYKLALPLYPQAIGQFDFSDYDLVVSLSHAAAKNVIVPPHVRHVSYCFTPMRYIWDQAEAYLGKATVLAWPLIAYLRAWDTKGAQRVSDFVAISKFVAARIRCFYGREATVIYPPVDSSWIEPAAPGSRGEAFLYAGALVPYKRVDLLIRAFAGRSEKLWIVGFGPEAEKLKAMAGPNVEFFGWVPDHELATFYRRSRALLFPAVEDFGIIPLEALAAGRPVIGVCDGALRETLNGVKPWISQSIEPSHSAGVFFRGGTGQNRQDEIEALGKSLNYFLEHEGQFSVENCINQAKLFSPARFFGCWRACIEGAGDHRKFVERYAEAKKTAF
jgi:glycosyltransferase involved in cell wall biosynthesis